MEAFALRALKKDVIIRSFIFTLSDTTSRFASLLVTLNSSAYIFWLCLFQILNPVLLHCVSAGVFVLLQVYAFLQYLKDRLTRQEFQTLFFLGVSLAAGVVFLSVIYLTYTGWLSIRRLVVYLTVFSKDR